MNVTIRFTTKWPPNLSSQIIAILSRSKIWSHCMLIIDNEAYEATMLHGCRIVPVEEAMKGVAYYRDMTVDIPDIDAAIAFGKAQEGKGYDFIGALGIPLMMSDDWGDWSKWWCSEEVFAMVGAGGLWMLDPDEQKRVTPQDILQCNFPKTEVQCWHG
jgi:hypothetical protein